MGPEAEHDHAMGLINWIFGKKPDLDEINQSDAVSLTVARIAPGRGFTLDLVGESHHQGELDSICGGKCEDGYRAECTAQLYFTDNNPHDLNAIGVMVDGKPVGFLPRDVTEQLRADILRINPDRRPVTCNAKIVGGWDRGDGDEGHYGVKLSLSQPLRLIDLTS
jgi:hypothetical protein